MDPGDEMGPTKLQFETSNVEWQEKYKERRNPRWLIDTALASFTVFIHLSNMMIVPVKHSKPGSDNMRMLI